ncbi:MAG: hypothetical protein PHU47_00355 [Candidatus ainarchaeum sp.]|nr:hypothetical protein [Candidatus ainarchaeum sp.]
MKMENNYYVCYNDEEDEEFDEDEEEFDEDEEFDDDFEDEEE